jgi:general stress protein 26
MLTMPRGELDPGFSDPNATPTPWAEATQLLEAAQTYWLTTVRPDGRPHVTTLFGFWTDGAFYFCTGPDERKAQNLKQNSHCIVTTGSNSFSGLDVVLEGDAVRVVDDGKLQRLVKVWIAKYADAPDPGLGETWRFFVRDAAFAGPAGNFAHVFEVQPETAFGFTKGASSGQTRWRFVDR